VHDARQSADRGPQSRETLTSWAGFFCFVSGLFWFSLSGTFVGEPGEMKA